MYSLGIGKEIHELAIKEQMLVDILSGGLFDIMHISSILNNTGMNCGGALVYSFLEPLTKG